MNPSLTSPGSLVLIAISSLACGVDSRLPDSGGLASDDSPRETESQVARIQVTDTLFWSFREGEIEGFKIPFVYTNLRSDTLYHPTCRPNGGAPTVAMGLQRLIDGEWVDAWSQVLPACLSEPIVIPPGGHFRDTLDVRLHPQDTLHHPHLNPEVEINGTYRLIWYDLLQSYDPGSYPFGEPVDLWERLSITFELRRG